MSVTDEIRRKLQNAFEPEALSVIDDSASHIGHAGYREGGESHFNVAITAAAFRDMGRVARHRAVHDALGRDLLGRIHALSLDLRAP